MGVKGQMKKGSRASTGKEKGTRNKNPISGLKVEGQGINKRVLGKD